MRWSALTIFWAPHVSRAEDEEENEEDQDEEENTSADIDPSPEHQTAGHAKTSSSELFRAVRPGWSSTDLLKVVAAHTQPISH